MIHLLLIWHLLPDIGKVVQGLIKRLILLCEVQADEVIDRFPEKARSRYCPDTDKPCQILTEYLIGFIAKLRNVKQNIICPLGNGMCNSDVIKSL